jgi:parallel beta-helix repeat protein
MALKTGLTLFALLPLLAAGSQAPIVIQSDSDFANCGCVSGGTGTPANPFIIGPLSINKVTGVGISIEGTHLTKSFVISNVTIAGNGSSSATGIVLNHINPGGIASIVARVTGTQTSIQSLGVGILVENSSYLALDGGGANVNGAGVGNVAGTINKNFVGAIDVENSSHILVTGWQLSANGQDGSPDWVAFDPALSKWGVGGVRFFATTSSTIDHNAANNCTSISFSLFDSSGNTVSNNTADYPFTANFVVADGSSFNTLSGNVAGTADFIGYLVADPLPGTATLATYGASHNNLIETNISHTDGPTGNEVHSNVAPAFLGGFVVLNGAYGNVIRHNQDWASTGSGFAWAQAVPAATPIGVSTYPPTLHCNVTASEGGGGIANLNGNTWTGNIFRTIDPCLPAQ